MYIFLLGNHPKLSLAEILSLFPNSEVKEVSDNIAVVDGITDDQLNQSFGHM